MGMKNPTAPCICCYTNCETLIWAKQAINNKLQGIVATYLRCGVVTNNQIKKGAESVSDFFWSVNIWQSYKQERDCVCALCQHTAKRRRKCTKQSRSSS